MQSPGHGDRQPARRRRCRSGGAPSPRASAQVRVRRRASGEVGPFHPHFPHTTVRSAHEERSHDHQAGPDTLRLDGPKQMTPAKTVRSRGASTQPTNQTSNLTRTEQPTFQQHINLSTTHSTTTVLPLVLSVLHVWSLVSATALACPACWSCCLPCWRLSVCLPDCVTDHPCPRGS
jgi:hypothetical protein